MKTRELTSTTPEDAFPTRKPTGVANYTTTPIILPELPATVRLPNGSSFDTRRALPVARAVLLQAVLALKEIPGGATRTAYSLERCLFHLKRVKVAKREVTVDKAKDVLELQDITKDH